MKRFYCKKCERVIRVRQLPPDTELNTAPHVPAARLVGVCRWHQLAKGKK